MNELCLPWHAIVPENIVDKNDEKHTRRHCKAEFS
jgi:hypothetical protein